MSTNWQETPLLSKLRFRGKLRLRARLAGLKHMLLRRVVPGWQDRDKMSAELDFWISQWDRRLRSGCFWNTDVEDLLREVGEWPPNDVSGQLSYWKIRWMEARAHALRILREAQLTDLQFFVGKRVVDIGPGAVCFLEASGAQVGIAIEPLAREFAAHGLLLPSANTIYLPVNGEEIPLLDESVDIVVSRNNLDHVNNPAVVTREIHRILKPSGCFILIVHLEDGATVTEPHALSYEAIHHLVSSFETDRERILPSGRTEGGQTLAGIYRKRPSSVELPHDQNAQRPV